jgi:mannose-6-phosphate isomerase-like protein (cupin superfamily)
VQKINLAREAAQLTEFWCQQVVASGNGNLFKVAKGIGSTNWHSHDDQDEAFLVIEGHITIQMRECDVDLTRRPARHPARHRALPHRVRRGTIPARRA